LKDLSIVINVSSKDQSTDLLDHEKKKQYIEKLSRYEKGFAAKY